MSCGQAQFEASSEWMIYSCEGFTSTRGGTRLRSTSSTNISTITTYEAPDFAATSVSVAPVSETPAFVTTSASVAAVPTLATSVPSSSIASSSMLPAITGSTASDLPKASATPTSSLNPTADTRNSSSIPLSIKLVLGLAIPGCIVVAAIVWICLKRRRKDRMPCKLEGTTVGSQEQSNAQLASWDFNDRKLPMVSGNISPTDDGSQSLCCRSTMASSQLLRSAMSYCSTLGELPQAVAVGRKSPGLSPRASLTTPLPDATEIFPEAYDEKSVLREHGYGQ